MTMPFQLFQWNSPIPFPKRPAAIVQEFIWGEEVDGLIDLPIKEIIERLKLEFPEHKELPGSLVLTGESGPIEVSWSWQFVRYEAQEVAPADEEKLRVVGEAFRCQQLKPAP